MSFWSRTRGIARKAGGKGRGVIVGFPGQGNVRVGMADIWAQYPAGASVMGRVDTALGFSLSEIISSGPHETLRATSNAQPALLATCMAALAVAGEEAGWKGPGMLGSNVKAVAGHSVGEWVAAVADHVLSLEDAVRLLAVRGKAMEMDVKAFGAETAMTALFPASLPLVESVLAAHRRDGGRAGLACVNGPRQIVVSGPKEDVEAVVADVKAQGEGRRATELDVDVPFHNALLNTSEMAMAGLLGPESVFGVAGAVRKPAVPLIQGVSGDLATEGKDVVDGLVQGHTRPVQWASVVSRATNMGLRDWVLFGPSDALTGLVTANAGKKARIAVVDDDESVLETLADFGSSS